MQVYSSTAILLQPPPLLASLPAAQFQHSRPHFCHADGAARGTKRRNSQGRGSGAAAAAALDKQAAKEMRQRAQLFLNEAGEKMKAGACAALHDIRGWKIVRHTGTAGTENHA